MRTRLSPPVFPRAGRRQPPLGTDLRGLGTRVAASLVRAHADTLAEPLVRRAVRDAEALAAATSVPELALPILAEEKVAAMRAWYRRQQDILGRSAISFAA